MKKLILTLLLGGLSSPFLAQTARVQVIHNSADAAADTVDVYLNGSLLLDNFAFRTASPFIDAPAGAQLQIAIAPKTSTSVNDTIAGLTSYYTLTANDTYVLVADGIVSGTGYTPSKPFGLKVYAMGREASSTTGKTDVLVHHGSTDAPTVDVRERTAGLLVDNASYGDFAGYLELTTADYILDIQDATGSTTVASYSAPLATLNLTNKAIVVVASGFLDPTQNSNGKSFGLWVALPTGGNLVELPSVAKPTARVQVIHNSADAAADTVDVYLNGTLLLDNFAFRTSSPFIDAPAGAQLQIAIAPKTSTSVNDTIAGLTSYYTLTANDTYVLVADGIVSGTGYTPSKPFGLKVYAMGREASSTTGKTDVLVHHGSTDAPTVDVRERTAGLLVDNASYGDFAGYLELTTADYILDIQDAAGTTNVASYSAPLATLNLTNKAIVVVASGFLDPTQNSNGKSFGLWVALPTGGNLVELPSVAKPTARVQVIHNSADVAADTVDVYLNGTLLLDNFAFRTSSPFIDAPAGAQLQIAIAPKTSTSVNDTIAGLTSYYTLTANDTYVLVADGIVSGTGYTPSKPFGLKVYAMGREASSTTGKTDVLVHHGSTDAPTVDVRERTAGLLVDNASYGDFAGYLELTTADYILDIQDGAGTTNVASYSAPLATLNLTNKAIVVVASGFLDPTQNSNGKSFGLWVALPTGGNLVELPSVAKPTARVQVIHNSADVAADTVDVYLNGTLLLDNFAFRTASPFIDAPAGTQLQIAIAPKTSTSVNDTIAGLTSYYTLTANDTYVLVADGIVSGTGYTPSKPFGLKVYAMGREASSTTGKTDVLVHHGSTDAPTVDVRERTAGLLVDNASYGDFAGYLELTTADYILDIQDATGSTTVASYSAPLATLNLTNKAIVVVASGFLDPTQNSNGKSFGLWVALPTGGNLVELPTAVANSINELQLEQLTVYPNPTTNYLTIANHDMSAVNIRITDLSGREVNVNFSTLENNKIDVSNLIQGSYLLEISENNTIVGRAKFVKF